MNAKNIKIVLVIILIFVFSAGIVYAITSSQSNTPTDREQCKSGSIDSCVRLDKLNKQQRQQLEVKQQEISQKNKEVKDITIKLLSGSSFM